MSDFELNESVEKELGLCYHDNVVYGIGYAVGGGRIELCDRIFTTFNTGIDGGVVGALNDLSSRGVNYFAVAMKPVHIYTKSCEEQGTVTDEPDNHLEYGLCEICFEPLAVDDDIVCEQCLPEACIFCEMSEKMHESDLCSDCFHELKDEEDTTKQKSSHPFFRARGC